MVKIKNLYMVTPSGKEFPHMIKEHHKLEINEDELPKILKSYILPPGWKMRAVLKK